MKRILIGILASIGAFFVMIMIGVLSFAALSTKNAPVELPEKIVLTLTLDQGLPESHSPQSLLSALDSGGMGLTVHQMIQTLDQARLDKRVQGIAVDIQDGDFGLASVEEFRSAIERFRRSGKFAFIFADTLGQRPAMAEYFLASAFEQIWMQPMGELAITGFATEMPFARGAFDKLGIQPEMMHVGKYKSFPEMFDRREASPENREMTLDMLSQLNGIFIKSVAKDRAMKPELVTEFMTDSPLTSDRALAAGLIDSIGYRDEFDSYLEQLTKGGQAIALEVYHQNGPRPVPGEKFALISVSGALMNQADGQGMGQHTAIAEDIVQAIQAASEHKKIKAIIVRVDSPGGTPLAADMIRRAIELARTHKPVIVSMANTAASGGYWMSINADKIIAQPTTITGSIGVFGGKFNAKGLWNKLGVNWQSFPEDGQQDMWSPNQPFSQKSQAKIRQTMETTYASFIAKVSQGRHLKVAQVEALAQGRVWTGAQALTHGLVDALGGVDVAIDMARQQAKIPPEKNVVLEPFPKQPSLIEQLMQLVGSGAPMHMIGASIAQAFVASLNVMMLQSAIPTIQK